MSAPANSLQQPRVRRSTAGSPGSSSGCRLHPIRATVPYQLLSPPGGGQSSPTRTQQQSLCGGTATATASTTTTTATATTSTASCGSSPASPTLNSGAPAKQQRVSPENKDSCSPDSAVCRGERSKLQGRSSSAIRRTSSLDAITGPYLTGQWPRDSQGPYPSCMKDKATQLSFLQGQPGPVGSPHFIGAGDQSQTPGLWIDEGVDQGTPHQRSASWGSSDHLKEIAKLRLQLQRSKQGGRQSKDREQNLLQQSQQTQYSTICPPQSKWISSALSSVSVPKSLISRVPSCVEGINHELENVFISQDWEQGIQAMDVVDGRRAPFPPHNCHGNSGDTRDTDTQAPSSSDTSPSPRPCSPDYLHSTDGSPCSAEEIEKDSGGSSPLPKFATSPKPNNSYMFKREPPEGCERVKVFEEIVSGRSKGFPLFSCPDKNKVNFIPRGSAFCPVKLLCSSLFSSVSPSSSAAPAVHGDGGAGGPQVAPAPPAAAAAAGQALAGWSSDAQDAGLRGDGLSPDTGPRSDPNVLLNS